MSFIRLETRRLLLRDHVLEDLPSHHALMSDGKAMYYLDDIQTHSLRESEENLRAAVGEAALQRRTRYFLRMELRETGEHIGEVGYTVTDFLPVGKIVNLGYFTRPACWNHGYVTEAVREVLRFAFEEDGVFRLETGCIRENGGSERVMQKCGLVKEADLREKVWHDGRMKDRVEYRLLRSEWLAKR